jgi:hypothetical protein
VWPEVHNVGALRRRFVDAPCRNQEHEGTQPHDECAAPSHSHFDARPRASVPIAARSAHTGRAGREYAVARRSIRGDTGCLRGDLCERGRS